MSEKEIIDSVVTVVTFDQIKHTTEDGIEYWLARELQEVLEYKQWRRFEAVIDKAKAACELSGNDIKNHFANVGKMVELGSGSEREIVDIMLSRYACYLIVQNADARKKVVAQGQSYFAVQTRKQELLDEQVAQLSEEERRLALRENVRTSNKILFDTAQKSGVSNFGKFNNAGYEGLYNGETRDDIKKRKGLTKKSQDILDYMGPTELAANWFRITQTDEKLKNESVNNENQACITHKNVGAAVRKTMIEISGTAPEELPTPDKGIKQLEREKNRRLKLTQKELKKAK